MPHTASSAHLTYSKKLIKPLPHQADSGQMVIVLNTWLNTVGWLHAEAGVQNIFDLSSRSYCNHFAFLLGTAGLAAQAGNDGKGCPTAASTWFMNNLYIRCFWKKKEEEGPRTNMWFRTTKRRCSLFFFLCFYSTLMITGKYSFKYFVMVLLGTNISSLYNSSPTPDFLAMQTSS